MSELLKSAISEIDYALVSNKGGKEVREHYLNNAKRYINEAEKEQEIQLNADQQIVLDWLKSKCLHSSLGDIISELAFLNCTGGRIRYKLVSVAWISLNEYKQLEVLQAFAEWGLRDK
ncbi:hypothetical protein [Carnobacterium maltaromaticum]|uniref:hypothetical protein n=1 Tax=Carnobacterium maltaromaticum TaxID=2751 RepID=UPI00191B93C2|nr:hypothetical protein [Carnobacterium maltaromaticum]CAD5896909.1 conserved hypothetical protein [Carnobacterium maltaromaticum]